jgi:2-deoxy-D-gluconate 3-dehydrogenase
MSDTSSVTAATFGGKTALVTGAAGGIGSAIARALARQGATVLGVDAVPAVQTVMVDIGGQGLCGDLTDPAFSAAVVEAAVAVGGGLDVLINAAGIQLRTEAVDVDEQGWQRLLDVNLSAAYRLTRLAAKQLIARQGCVVNIASMSADRAMAGIVPYGATKAALTQLGKGLAVELGPVGVRVNTVAPGYIETAMTADGLSQPESRNRILARIPLQRFGVGDDVADVVVFLCSAAARYVTGIVLPVDGGYSIT